MIVSRKILQVYPNPFSAPFDHEGRPCGVFQADPDHYHGVRHVGAVVMPRVVGARKKEFAQKSAFVAAAGGKMELAVRAPGRTGQSQTAQIDVAIAYAFDAPTPLQDTHYHRAAIRSEELIAADEQTARLAGVVFVPPGEVLARWRAEQEKQWRDQHGEAPPYELWGDVGAALTDLAPVTAPALKSKSAQ